MKKAVALLTTISLLLVLVACNNSCHICGRNHPHNADGEPTPKNYFEIYANYSNEYLRIFVESCWSSSVQPEFRLGFVASYNIDELYEAISVADSNAPFEVALEDETIILTTDIEGLEKVFITLHHQPREVGFNYNMRRQGE